MSRLYCGPRDWAALTDTTPAARDEWVRRLGGGPGAQMAVAGAIGRRELLGDGRGRLAWVRAQLALDLNDTKAG